MLEAEGKSSDRQQQLYWKWTVFDSPVQCVFRVWRMRSSLETHTPFCVASRRRPSLSIQWRRNCVLRHTSFSSRSRRRFRFRRSICYQNFHNGFKNTAKHRFKMNQFCDSFFLAKIFIYHLRRISDCNNIKSEISLMIVVSKSHFVKENGCKTLSYSNLKC